ncbi:MAG: endonuclease/exonuclease/phosphatase family protein [Chlorobi bacterium]|nr:endonuclease/exonuclease/phosphatase family protein [Chlorobiota bacterium]
MKREIITAVTFSFLLVFLQSVLLRAQDDKKIQVAVIGFYNLENLFDTIDDPEKRDEEFLPNGTNKWDTEKYLHKIGNMSKVISKIGKSFTPDGISVLGISEIENRAVIEDLINTPLLKPFHFRIIHYDSPDRRGVDVAMIYQPKYLEVTETKSYRLVIPDMPDFYTRNQLLVSGKLLGEDIYFIVVHWPSRYGGEKRSRPLRNAAAELSRHICDSLLALNPDSKIIVMGDLNDNPTNESIKKIMRAKPDTVNLAPGDFYNPMYKLYKKGIGSTAWMDTWSLFDETLLSQGLLGNNFETLTYFTVRIFNKPFMQQKEGRYKGYPYRTFAGGTWMGGYSDHFPVFVVLAREIK